jgi:uncharacterized protein
VDLSTLGVLCEAGTTALGRAAEGAAVMPLILFAFGLTGSVGHCAPMCGPFVLAQIGDRLANVPAARLCEATRFESALLLPYHLGRLCTYTALGAAAASLGGLIGYLPWFAHMSGVLLLLAALLCLAQSAKTLLPLPAVPIPWIGTLARRAAAIDRRQWLGGLQLGLLLGFLPCGLVYAALAASAAGRPWQGALAMFGFGLGTVPSLLAIGIAGHLGGRRWRQAMARLGPAIQLVNGVLLAGIGWARLIG